MASLISPQPDEIANLSMRSRHENVVLGYRADLSPAAQRHPYFAPALTLD